MTQDFKNNILAWLVGKYEVEDPSTNEPTFLNTTTKQNNFYADLIEKFDNNFTLLDTINTKLKDSNASLIVAYGFYDTNPGDISNEECGFISIIDEKGNTQQIITEYNNGTKLRPFITLNVTDEGIFYGIDRPSASFNNKRVILLNNFTIKLPPQTDYEIVLRNSYNIPSSSGAYISTSEIEGIKKSPSGATYLIYGSKPNTNNHYQPFTTAFKINVGSENEWVEYSFNNNAYDIYVRDIYVTDWENLYFSLGTYDYTVSTGLTGYAEYSISQQDVYTFTRNLKATLQFTNQERFGLGYINIVSATKAYLSYYIVNESQRYYLQYLVAIDRSTNEVNYIYEQNSDPVIVGDYIVTKEVNGNIFFVLPEWLVNSDSGTFYIGVLVDDEPFVHEIAEMSVYTHIKAFYMANTFNLYNYNVLIDDYDESTDTDLQTMYTSQIVFNANNYNGEAYKGLGGLKPNSSILYNNDNLVIFARNLYNRVIQSNVTTSTVEIPNTYLNDEVIAKQELLSETNNILNVVSSNIQKNIYETLNINFINTINIKNSNNPNNEILNPLGASRLNNSISLTTDYNNAKGTKYRLNYTDNTSLVRSILDSQITCINNTATYDFVIYTAKLVNSIDIISNDEATVYQTIDGSSLALNKFYKITQEVEII